MKQLHSAWESEARGSCKQCELGTAAERAQGYGDDDAELDGWRHGRPQRGADTQFGIHPDFWANNKHPVFCKPTASGLAATIVGDLAGRPYMLQ